MEKILSTDVIKKSIIKSQHCQRNWDLSKNIPDEDLQLIVHAATECPSKQNTAFYGLHFITNRDIINSIHECTSGFVFKNGNVTTNSQVLANLLIVFEDLDVVSKLKNKETNGRNIESKMIRNNLNYNEHFKNFNLEIAEKNVRRDAAMAVGIAAGYINLTANILGYSTGCCLCMSDSMKIAKLLNINKPPLLLMGVGFKDNTRSRREHHLNPDIVFPAIKKQPIPVNFIK